jgi:hypothetical protein
MRAPPTILNEYTGRAVFDFVNSDTDVRNLSRAQVRELLADAEWYSDPKAVDIDGKLRSAYRRWRDRLKVLAA